jgi:hypothetical protein
MTYLRRACCTLAAGLALLMPSHAASGALQRENGDRKPSLSLRAAPALGSSPLRVRASVELRGGSDDYQDFYCPSVEWDWGDGTMSEASADCAPYEAGKTTIQRRYSADHVYRESGAHRLQFRLKQRNRPVAATNTTITVRRGAGESPFDN